MGVPLCCLLVQCGMLHAHICSHIGWHELLTLTSVRRASHPGPQLDSRGVKYTNATWTPYRSSATNARRMELHPHGHRATGSAASPLNAYALHCRLGPPREYRSTRWGSPHSVSSGSPWIGAEANDTEHRERDTANEAFEPKSATRLADSRACAAEHEQRMTGRLLSPSLSD